MTLRKVTAVASDNSRRYYRKAPMGFRMLRDNPPRRAFTSFPSSLDYDVAIRREQASDDPPSFDFLAFRNADLFTTFKIFRRPGARRGLTNQLRCFRSRFGRSD